jgi:serine phosphatase RsbU (regulator of sigma subunit)
MERHVPGRSAAATITPADREVVPLLADMVRQFATAVAVIDRQRRYVAVSHRWAQSTGISVESHRGRLVADLPAPVGELPDLVEHVLATGHARIGVPVAGAALESHQPRSAATVLDVYPLAGDKEGTGGVGVQLRSLVSDRSTRVVELELLQRSLLPTLPELPGVELCSHYLPASAGADLGGDWYDVLSLPRGALGLVVGDVVGHDIQAAAAMAQLRAALRSYASEGYGPLAVLSRLDAFASTLAGEMFASVFYARLRLPGLASGAEGVMPVVGTGLLRYANAGHPPPLLLPSDGEPRYLDDAVRTLVGVESSLAVSEQSHRIPPGSTLVLFTDGLIERRTSDLDEGLQHLKAAAKDAQPLALSNMCNALLEELLGSQPREDDVALLAIRLQGAPDG